ncbi:hypothetical protein K402DRAFT_89645 [Aulographum hederae CBS 113979]|uniref:DUF1680-domain-containing protein n=1 Tax=Aulographum hederae CBS 113979 TaxID=1176131 RepID=A0A6G1H0C9_9PEZI|nr:hypothetical protein K402DRAFT_89645 [Aulographum hederae CBS 113979]
MAAMNASKVESSRFDCSDDDDDDLRVNNLDAVTTTTPRVTVYGSVLLPERTKRKRTVATGKRYSWCVSVVIAFFFIMALNWWGLLSLTAFINLFYGQPAEAAIAHNRTLLPLLFKPLPLGSIKPRGWLADQMQLSAEGLAGHEHDFYRFVKDSPWLGGNEEYAKLNEGFPYWFNGIVPLAYGLNDERLKGQVYETVAQVIGSQSEDGWLGPETGSARNLWARYPFLLGLIQLLEADSKTYASTVLPAIHKFVGLMHKMLSNDLMGYVWHEGDELNVDDTAWGRVRMPDLLISLHWLLENDPAGQEDIIWSCMDYLLKGQIDWAEFFREGVFPKGDVSNIPESQWRPLFPYMHGVNLGQGLKFGAVIRRFTRNDTLLDYTMRGVDWTMKYHSFSSGAILADERIEGLGPYYGSELCTVVETMYSLSYLYQALGNPYHADLTELAAYNALPAMLTPDHWAHQYIAQPNQPESKKLPDAPFWNVQTWGQTFGLEPNYPCCTVNHPQGYPKFLSAAYATVADSGLAHTLLAPAAVNATLPNGNIVTVDCTTSYPFDLTLIYSITAAESFTFFVRVPAWADIPRSSISLKECTSSLECISSLRYLNPDKNTRMQSVQAPAGKSSVTYTLSASPKIEQRANNTVAITYGPLLYALEVGGRYQSGPPKIYNSSVQAYPAGYAPDQVQDYEIFNTTAWSWGIDPSTLKFENSLPSNRDGDAVQTLANPIWAADAPPTSMRVMGCPIVYAYHRGVPAWPAEADPMRRCVGNGTETELRLVPYGSAKLRMGEMAVVGFGDYGGDGDAVGEVLGKREVKRAPGRLRQRMGWGR